MGGANSGELSAFLTSAWDISASDIVVALISLILETGKLARANISLDTGLVADIDEAAARRGVTRSAFLATAARDRIRAGA
ncbi:type II toxin-antitoxin system HicB family antitoxin [Devosia sp.]|uniref:type II toxin-antitoxin system HicB family antitoxin n=1 Tax=Devosia sp. TaxID=1871048 RepID=UPI003BAC33B9